MNIQEKLSAPFSEDEIEWRVQSCGVSGDRPWAQVLCYVQNRAIQNRLDDVFGVYGWQNDFKPVHGGFICGIGIKHEGEWIWKWDGAQETDIEATKGGLSGAMKRAAVHFGIGRYLYNLKTTFAECSLEKKQGWIKAKTRDGKAIWWDIPKLPDWALPPPKVTKEQKAQLIEVAKVKKLTPERSKEILASFGYGSSSEILAKDFDKVFEAFGKE